MRQRGMVGFGLLLFLLVGLLITQALSIFVTLGTVVDYVYTATAYAAIAGLLWLERAHLEDFHFDRLTLVLLVLSSFFRTRLGVSSEGYLLLVIGLCGASIAILLFRHGAQLQGGSPRWLLVSAVVSCAVLVPLALVESPRFQPVIESTAASIPIVPAVLRQVVYELSFNTLVEEVVFRGFLWGYLRLLNWPESRAMWFQGVVFWLFHFPQATFAAHFFLAVPLGAIVYTALTKKSKQLGPAVVSHTIINAITPLIAATFHL